MSSEIASLGKLFSSGLLPETIQRVSAWSTHGNAVLNQFGASLRSVFNRFPVVEREEKDACGSKYWFCELCLTFMNALAAGNLDAEINL